MYIHNITRVIHSTVTVVSTRSFPNFQVQPEEKFADLSELHHARLGEFMRCRELGGPVLVFNRVFYINIVKNIYLYRG